MVLINRQALIEELAEILLEMDVRTPDYEEDVYAYYYPNTKTAELETYVTCGANVRANDDHICIYTHQQNPYSGWEYFFETDGEIAAALDMDVDYLREQAAEWAELDEDDELEWWHLRDYCRVFHNDSMTNAHRRLLKDDHMQGYLEHATEVIDELEDNIKYDYDITDEEDNTMFEKWYIMDDKCAVVNENEGIEDRNKAIEDFRSRYTEAEARESGHTLCRLLEDEKCWYECLEELTADDIY